MSKRDKKTEIEEEALAIFFLSMAATTLNNMSVKRQIKVLERVEETITGAGIEDLNGIEEMLFEKGYKNPINTAPEYFVLTFENEENGSYEGFLTRELKLNKKKDIDFSKALIFNELSAEKFNKMLAGEYYHRCVFVPVSINQ